MSVPTELVGKRVGNNRIELLSLLGEGSYGAVYHGIFHRGFRTPKHCAVKVQRTSLDERQRVCLQRELELHQRVSQGDGIVPLYETFKEGEYTFIVMKFCPDGDLWTSINRGRFLGNDALIKDIFTQVLDATEYCHSRSVYHRDIKPENILLCGHKALLADFGLATDEPMSKEMRAGSPWYMSPECWGLFPSLVEEPYPTAPNDVWGLGILLINLTCARHAPWKHAHQMDRFFHDFTRQPNLLRLFVPLSPQVHDILAQIFVPSSGARISIKDLRSAIKDVKHFNIPSSCRREYHNYQRAVWKTAIGPSPSRPLSIKAIPPFKPLPVSMEVNGLNDSAKENTLVGSSHGPSTPVLDHDITAVDNSHQGWLSRGNSRSLPALPHSSSSSSVDSDGPATPDMPPTVPDIEIPDIVDLSQNGPQPLVVAKPLPPTPKAAETTPLITSPDSWQGVLEAIRAI